MDKGLDILAEMQKAQDDLQRQVAKDLVKGFRKRNSGSTTQAKQTLY